MVSKEDYKRALDILDKAFKNIEDKSKKGTSLNVAELHWVKNYPDVRKEYEKLLASEEV